MMVMVIVASALYNKMRESARKRKRKKKREREREKEYVYERMFIVRRQCFYSAFLSS
jgi:hypothetical protein